MQKRDITSKSRFKAIEAKVRSNTRLTEDDALYLFEEAPIIELGQLANEVNQKKNGDTVLYNVNRHINPTNVCVMTCKFCAYSKKPGQEGAYEYSIDQILQKADEAVSDGATEVHMVGGLHPRWKFSYYKEMLSAIKERHPKLHIKGFTAVEIDWLAKKARLSVSDTLQELRAAGLDSMPGGGAEIFHQEVRDEICAKLTGDQWIDTHRTAHNLGMHSNCTMLYGHVEKTHHRVDHLSRLRALQDETNGFNVFIPLSFQPHQNDMGITRYTYGLDDLRTIAVARLFLDNFQHIKAYWIMLGQDIAQLSLHFGANDLDGTVKEEKISRAAGGRAGMIMDKGSLNRLIHQADKTAQERGTLYNLIGEAVLPQAKAWSFDETERRYSELERHDVFEGDLDELHSKVMPFSNTNAQELLGHWALRGDFLAVALKSAKKREDSFARKTSFGLTYRLILEGGVMIQDQIENFRKNLKLKSPFAEQARFGPRNISISLAHFKSESLQLDFSGLLQIIEDVKGCVALESAKDEVLSVTLVGIKNLSYLLSKTKAEESHASLLSQLGDVGVTCIESAFNESESGMTDGEVISFFTSIQEAGIKAVGKAELYLSAVSSPLLASFFHQLELSKKLDQLGLLNSVIVATTSQEPVTPVEYFRALALARMVLPSQLSVTTPLLSIPALSLTAGIGSLETQHPQEKIASFAQVIGADDLGNIPVREVEVQAVIDQINNAKLLPQLRESNFNLL